MVSYSKLIGLLAVLVVSALAMASPPTSACDVATISGCTTDQARYGTTWTFHCEALDALGSPCTSHAYAFSIIDNTGKTVFHSSAIKPECFPMTDDEAAQGCYYATDEAGHAVIELVPDAVTFPAGTYNVTIYSNGTSETTNVTFGVAAITSVSKELSFEVGKPFVREFYLPAQDVCVLTVFDPRTNASFYQATAETGPTGLVRFDEYAPLWLANFTVNINCSDYSEAYDVAIIERSYTNDVYQWANYALTSHSLELLIGAAAFIVFLAAGITYHSQPKKRLTP